MSETKRPGQFIKLYLQTNGIDDCHIPGIHSAYKEKIDSINAGRDRTTRLSKPTYQNFYRYFKHFVYMSMVEEAGESPTEDMSAPDKMGYVVKSSEGNGDKLTVRQGITRKLWRLTSKGETENDAWDNPIKARGY